MELIKHFCEAGHEVHVFAGKDEFCAQLNFSSHVRFRLLNFLKPVSKNPVWDIFCFVEILKNLWDVKPDLLLNYTVKPNIYGSLASRVLGIRTVSNLTGLGFAAEKTGWHKFIFNFYKMALQKNEVVVFHNEEDRLWFVKEKLIKEAQSICIPGSGVDSEYFKPEPGKQKGEKFIFLFVGRLIKAKGIFEFLDAAERLAQYYPQAEWWILGRPANERNHKKQEKKFEHFQKNKQIRFLGFQQDVRVYLRQARVFVLPSYREGMPRSLMEAMSMELPVITTRVAGCKHAVEDRLHGFLVEPESGQSLYVAMEACLNLPETELEQMGKNGRQRILNNFAMGRIIQGYDKILNKLINQHPLNSNR
ncbi:MAG: glycosyltransferase family 4 protein [Saprospiraceae bacterium]|nr:glycosyltransferase family 4 protein [Saprospiraceae bacterium]